MVLEGEMFVEQVAADAAKEVVGSWGSPVSKMKDIVEYEHDGGTYNCIYHTHHDKLHESLVSKKSYLIF